MAYIGQGIKQGTFKVLDTSGNTYNGSNTTFNLGTQVGSAAQLLVSHDGVIQKAGTDYTLATGGTQITFSTAPASGASIFIVEISGAVGGTVTPSDTSVTADKLNTALLTGHTDIGAAIADADLFLVDDGAGGTLRKTAASRIKTYVGGFDVTSITGATALAEQPASTDELVISDGGTLKRLDFAHIFCKPSFHVHASGNQNLNDNTLTKINFPSEDYDADSTYDNSSNFRFTPGVAGKYHLYFLVKLETGANNNNIEYIEGHIYKNGSTISKFMNDFRDDKDGRAMTVMGSSVVESDADDYFEIYALINHDAGQGLAAGGNHETFFGGYRLVGA